MPPEVEGLIQVFSYFYGVPWEVVAGLLLSEIKLDTQPKDYFETAFMHMMPKLAGEGNAGASILLTFALLLKPDPGPGIGNVHVSTAKYLSTQFATRYAGNPLMQLNLHGMSTAEVGYQLTDVSVNIQVVAAYTRHLTDYRFGSGGRPSTSSHAGLAEWSVTDAVAVWHGYRFGVKGISPGGQGFTVSNFQNRRLDLATTVDLAEGVGKEASMSGSETYFNYYWGR